MHAVIADFAVCPFTIDPNRAGIPLGGVRYSISRATDADEALLKFWQEVGLLLKVGPISYIDNDENDDEDKDA